MLQSTIEELKSQELENQSNNAAGDAMIIAAIGLGIAGIAIGAASFARKK